MQCLIGKKGGHGQRALMEIIAKFFIKNKDHYFNLIEKVLLHKQMFSQIIVRNTVNFIKNLRNVRY